ncbi:MAG TPA: hypothetical protein PK858_09050, partial [Saprospiraceae bacterium]|nr:hypothetical protein [Saprospiraceae bacterium]
MAKRCAVAGGFSPLRAQAAPLRVPPCASSSMLLRLDLLPLQNRLRLRRAEGVQWVYDPIRRKHVVLTPE